MAERYEDILQSFYTNPQLLEDMLVEDLTVHYDVWNDIKIQASTYGKWSSFKTIALTNFKAQKNLYELQIWPAAIMRAIENNEDGKASQWKVEYKAAMDPAVISAKATISKYGHVLDLLKGACEAMAQKKDMLSVLGYGNKRELYSTPDTKTDLESWVNRQLPPKLSIEELESMAEAALSQKR